MIVKSPYFPCDVDGTLTVRPEDPGFDPNKQVPVWDVVTKSWIKTQINLNTVRLLNEKNHQGYFIHVWTQGGAAWGEAVVNAAGIRGIVNLISEKPKGYMDDMPCEKWMGEKILITQDIRYKL